MWGLLPLCDATHQLSLPDSPPACSTTITRKNRGNYFGATSKFPLILSAMCPRFSPSLRFLFLDSDKKLWFVLFSFARSTAAATGEASLAFYMMLYKRQWLLNVEWAREHYF